MQYKKISSNFLDIYQGNTLLYISNLLIQITRYLDYSSHPKKVLAESFQGWNTLVILAISLLSIFANFGQIASTKAA